MAPSRFGGDGEGEGRGREGTLGITGEVEEGEGEGEGVEGVEEGAEGMGGGESGEQMMGGNSATAPAADEVALSAPAGDDDPTEENGILEAAESGEAVPEGVTVSTSIEEAPVEENVALAPSTEEGVPPAQQRDSSDEVAPVHPDAGSEVEAVSTDLPAGSTLTDVNAMAAIDDLIESATANELAPPPNAPAPPTSAPASTPIKPQTSIQAPPNGLPPKPMLTPSSSVVHNEPIPIIATAEDLAKSAENIASAYKTRTRRRSSVSSVDSDDAGTSGLEQGPSRNRLSILYEDSSRRLCFDAEGVRKVRVFREVGKIEVVLFAGLDVDSVEKVVATDEAGEGEEGKDGVVDKAGDEVEVKTEVQQEEKRKTLPAGTMVSQLLCVQTKS